MSEQYDFAFSFAGEDREVVEKIKDGLVRYNYKVFYDRDVQSELVGKDLFSYLRRTYMKQTKYVVCFLSENYKRKIWTNLEFSAVKERLMSTFFASDFLIPIILDEDFLLEDLPSFIGFYKHISIDATIQLLKDKYDKFLIEDYHLDNIKNFITYLVKEIEFQIQNRKIMTKSNNNSIKIIQNLDEKEFFFESEDFTYLPCILLHEYNVENPPSAIITWIHNEHLEFSWNPISSFEHTSIKGISLMDLIDEIQYFLTNNER